MGLPDCRTAELCRAARLPLKVRKYPWRFINTSQATWDGRTARLLDCLLPGGLLVATVNGKGWDDLDWDTLLEGSRRRHGFSIDSLEDIPYLVKQGIRGKLLVLKP